MAAKLTYDTVNKIFVLNPGVTELDLKTDLYSSAKQDWKNDLSLNKFRFPIKSDGGFSIGGGQTATPYFTLLYGWKIRPQEADHILTITGNVITDDDSDPFLSTQGAYNVRTKFIVPATSITDGGGSSVKLDEIHALLLDLNPLDNQAILDRIYQQAAIAAKKAH